MVFVIQDVGLHTFIDPDALHHFRQHPLTVGNIRRCAAFDSRTVLGQAQALHSLFPCGTAVFAEGGPCVAGENGVGMGVHFRDHFA